MGFRFRKSFKIVPGIRMNFGKRGVGISAGVKGARVSISTRGLSSSVGVPGTGLSWGTTLPWSAASSRGGRRRSTSGPTLYQQPSGPTSAEIRQAFAFPAAPSALHKWRRFPYWWLTLLLTIGMPPVFLLHLGGLTWYHFSTQKRPDRQAYALWSQARGAWQGKRYEQCQKLSMQVRDLGFTEPVVQLALARCAYHLQQWETATTHFKEYTQQGGTLRPKVGAVPNLAFVEAAGAAVQTDPEWALSLVVDQPLDPIVATIRGEALLALGHTTAAIEVCRQLIGNKRTVTEELLSVWQVLGEAYEVAGDKTRARKVWEKIYAFDPSAAGAAEVLGISAT